MNALLVYMLKSAIYMAAFYMVYAVLLSRDTSYGRNRGFILFSITASLVLPFITVGHGSFLPDGIITRWISGVLVSAGRTGGQGHETATGLPWLKIINAVYLSGVILYLLKFIFDLMNLIFLIARQRNAGSRIIRFSAFSTPGFSAMGYIFINSRLTAVEEEEIIRHERNHLHKNHFIDIIFAELVKSFHWFNPAVYLFNRSLRAVHEYQADDECLKSGTTVTGYQSLLLRQVLKNGSLNLSNSFSNPSLIRKRMLMMTKRRTSSLANMKLFFAIPVAGLVLLLVSSAARMIPAPNMPPAKEITAADQGNPGTEPYVSVDVMPVFPGGDEALLKYLATNTRYPENAKKNGIQGRVVVRFCVTETGDINRIGIIQGVDPELDRETVRVIGTLPRFMPGKIADKAVPVWLYVPLTFTLK